MMKKITNGFTNGHSDGGLKPKGDEDTSFLFTSESVGEGHPGKRYISLFSRFIIIRIG